MIQESDFVALVTRKVSKRMLTKVLPARKGQKYRFRGKVMMDMSLMIGKEFNQWYRFDFKSKSLSEVNNPYRVPFSVSGNDDSDNRSIVDNGKNQELSCEDVINLKKSISGEELVNHLVKGNKSFDSKTIFSQQKYIERKKIKHEYFLLAKRPCCRVICETFCGSLSRYNFMRFDAVSYLLKISNAHSYSHVGVFDTCQGIVLSSIYEKMGGENGKIYRFFPALNTNGNFNALRILPKFCEWQKSIKRTTARRIRRRRKKEEKEGEEEQEEKEEQEQEQEEFEEKRRDKLNDFLVHISLFYFFGEQMRERLQSMNDFDERIYELLKRQILDSLVIATDDYDLKELFDLLFPLLKLSGVFAVYSKKRQNLEELLKIITTDKNKPYKHQTTMVKLENIFSREYQVLEKRTHPKITMTQESGYVLWGIKIQGRKMNQQKQQEKEEEIREEEKEQMKDEEKE